MSNRSSSSSISKAYLIEEGRQGRTMVVTGEWTSAAAAALAHGDIDGLDLNYAKGYRERNLDFIGHWPIRRLSILSRTTKDLSPIYRLCETLQEVDLEVAPQAHVDLGRFPKLTAVSADWLKVKESISKVAHLRDANFSDYDDVDMRPLSYNKFLESVRIKIAPRLGSLDGIDRLSSLSLLEVVAAHRLSDISALAEAHLGIQELEFQSCWSISSLDYLRNLTNLRFLGVSECGDIASLEPLTTLSNLRALYAFGTTKIVDGNLDPLINLPHLAEIRLQPRRHYRPSVVAVEKLLATRGE